jgi:sulfate transport system permease protein
MTQALSISPVIRPSRKRRVIPGLGLSIGYSMLYLSLIVLIPLAGLALKTASLSWHEFWSTVTEPQVVASYKLTFGAATVAAAFNAVFGLIVAWVLVRYPFPGRKIFDAIVDLPFALPTAVAGITFGNLYTANGWIGQLQLGTWIAHALNKVLPGSGIDPAALSWLNLDYNNTTGGIVIVLIFIGLPFIVRSVQPVLLDMDRDVEEAAQSLGADRWYTFRRVIFPTLLPAWLSGLALAFARAVGEYGSVIFIAGNIPGKSQIAPQLIVTKLSDHKVAQATAIAVVLLGASLLMLLLINGIEWWSRRHERA